ncbi:MAG: GTPase ObgE [Actinobacteria bacterium]|nr:GTPase ObgE [Actinomycetota bacterium]
MFLDEAKINVKGGDGGNGAVSFFFLKGSYKKIASGGSGGKGGNVIIEASTSIATLLAFKKKVHHKAEKGHSGMPNNRSGRNGADCIIKVPVGTVIKDNGIIVADLDFEAKQYLAATGGIGGKGNASFVSQQRRFPGFAEFGEKVEEKWITLELRLLADAALVGFPNAGKSTLISRISAARPKIASYPFTTLVPNLGVVEFEDDTFVVADIPGIIEGAHKGTGLGDRFLRHVLRSKIIVIVLDLSVLLDSTTQTLEETFQTLRNELKLYSNVLYKRDYLVLLNKSDLVYSKEELKAIIKKFTLKTKKPVMAVSAATGEGINGFISSLYKKIKKAAEKEAQDKKAKEKLREGFKLYTLQNSGRSGLENDSFSIIRDGQEYTVKNKKLERMISMMDLQNEEALNYLKYKLKKLRIGDRLKKMGINEGSTVIIGDLVFELEE